MLIYQLVRKDILIIRNSILFSLLILAAIPILTMILSASAPFPLHAAIPLAYMVVLGQVIILQTIAQEEAKRPKTLALLCAAPFPRKTVVYAKYVTYYLIFFYCLGAHTLVTLLLRGNPLNLTSILAVMLAGSLVFAIYMPIEFKYGLIKAKLIFMSIILLFSLGPALIVPLIADIRVDLSFLALISNAAKNLMLIASQVLIMAVSLRTSLDIFTAKEL